MTSVVCVLMDERERDEQCVDSHHSVARTPVIPRC